MSIVKKIDDLSYLENLPFETFIELIDKSDYINTLSLCKVSKSIKERCNTPLLKKIIFGKRIYIKLLEPKIYLVDMKKFFKSKEWEYFKLKIFTEIYMKYFTKFKFSIEQFEKFTVYFDKKYKIIFSTSKILKIIYTRRELTAYEFEHFIEEYYFITHDIIKILIEKLDILYNLKYRSDILFGNISAVDFRKNLPNIIKNIKIISYKYFKPLFKTFEDET